MKIPSSLFEGKMEEVKLKAKHSSFSLLLDRKLVDVDN